MRVADEQFSERVPLPSLYPYLARVIHERILVTNDGPFCRVRRHLQWPRGRRPFRSDSTTPTTPCRCARGARIPANNTACGGRPPAPPASGEYGVLGSP